MTSHSPLRAGAWKDLYVAALFEADKARLFERIARAEQALCERARELFHTPGDKIEEESAVDDAMYALHALRNAYQSKRDTLPAEELAA